MERMEALANYYTTHNEDARFSPKRGMVEFLTTIHYVGTDMLTSFIGDTVDEMDDTMFSLYMKYHLCICERRDMVGETAHMLDVFRKETIKGGGFDDKNTCDPFRTSRGR